MANVRLIDANALKEKMWRSAVDTREKIADIIDNAPTLSLTYCDSCEKAMECEKRKVNEEIDGCYEGIKVGD